MDKNIKKILIFLLKIVHVLYFIFFIISPYIFNDVRILLFLILIYVINLESWYLFNKCFLTDFEELEQEEKHTYKDGSKKSFITQFLQDKLNINEKYLYYFTSLIPVFNTIVCLIKIYIIINKKCKRSSYKK